MTLLLARRQDDAEAELRQALKLDPKHTGALYRLAVLLITQRRNLTEARKLAQTADQANPGEGYAAVMAAWALYLSGDKKAAVREMEQVARAHPTNFEAWARLAMGLKALGLTDSAKRAAEIAAQIAPRPPMILNTPGGAPAPQAKRYGRMATTSQGRPDPPEGRIAELERQLRAVHVIAAELGQQTEVESIVRRSLEVAMEVVSAQAGAVLLYDPEQDKLVFRYVVGGAGEEIVGDAVDTDQSIAGRAFRQGITCVSDEVGLDPDHSAAIEERTGYTTTSMVTVPLRASGGQSVGVVQVLNKRHGGFDGGDVAVLEILAHQIASRLENARLQQEARLAEVAKYVGHISHDLKNMMTPIQTGAQMLNEIAATDASQAEALLAREDLPEDARAEVEAIAGDLTGLVPEIVAMILEGALTTQQRMAEIANAVKGMIVQPTFEQTDVVEVAERVVHLLTMQAEGLGVAIRVEKDGEVPPAIVDGRQLYNALYNLVFNALEACEGKGIVTVTLRARPEGEFPDGNWVELEVRDTGKGIPEDVRRKLFTDQARSTKPTGTGLGTRIVKNVVDAHGGGIEVDSEEGSGTAIRLRLPLTR
jgi:signal transduction histidine kinase/Tfp pilus assembly protein PilF